MRPSVFIGSSSEGLEVARKVRAQLKNDAEITIWHEGVFGLNKGTLESLVAALSNFDFAILILTPDDMSQSREQSSQSPRDNVLFECGLFMGRLGRDRTYIVYDADANIKLPSDLAGVKLAAYRGGRKDNNLLAAIGEACDEIRDALKESSKPRTSDKTFYTEYQLGGKHYVEHLKLDISDNYISGIREFIEDGGEQTDYVVQGYSGDGYYYLEYHQEDGTGGGAIILRHLTSGRDLGLIIAPKCETGVLRCYRNRWLLNGNAASYETGSLKMLGEVDEKGNVIRRRDA